MDNTTGISIRLPEMRTFTKALSLIFMMMTFTYLFARGVSPTSPYANSITNSISMAQAFPFMFAMLTIHYNNKARLWAERVMTYKTIYITGLLVLGICAVLTFNGIVQSYWWTWFSVGLIVAIILYTMTLLNVPSYDAFIIGAAVATIWRGVWELPYQIGMKLTYDAPHITGEVLNRLLNYEVIAEMPLIIGGGIILYYYHNKYKVLNINRYVLIFGALYMALTTLWFVTGFWVELSYNWQFGQWFAAREINYGAMATYKASKVALGLALAYIVKGATWSNRQA